jgi:hypothetical protein
MEHAMNNLPFRPSPHPDSVLRDWHQYVAALTIAAVKGNDVNRTAHRLFGKDHGERVLKAATDGHTTTNTSALSATRVGSFLRSLRPRSAAAQLIDRVTAKYNLSGVASVTLPKLSADMPAPTWLSESGAVPVLRGTFDTSVLGPPRKLAALSAVTHELASLANEDAIQLVTELLEDSTAKQLDASLFSATAASSSRPAGLLNGVTPVTATSGGGLSAMVADVQALAGGIADAGLDANFLLFANPRQAAAMSILANGPQTFELIGHPSITAGTLVAIHPDALAVGFSAEPDVEVSENALIHMEDTSPLQISTPSSTNTIAAPVRSAWQTATHVLRCILDVAYVVRRAGAVQVITGATW